MPMKKQNARERERFMVRKKQTIQRKKNQTSISSC